MELTCFTFVLSFPLIIRGLDGFFTLWSFQNEDIQNSGRSPVSGVKAKQLVNTLLIPWRWALDLEQQDPLFIKMPPNTLSQHMKPVEGARFSLGWLGHLEFPRPLWSIAPHPPAQRQARGEVIIVNTQAAREARVTPDLGPGSILSIYIDFLLLHRILTVTILALCLPSPGNAQVRLLFCYLSGSVLKTRARVSSHALCCLPKPSSSLYRD